MLLAISSDSTKKGGVEWCTFVKHLCFTAKFIQMKKQNNKSERKFVRVDRPCKDGRPFYFRAMPRKTQKNN